MVNRKDLTLLVLGEKTREELPVRSRDLVHVSHDPLHLYAGMGGGGGGGGLISGGGRGVYKRQFTVPRRLDPTGLNFDLKIGNLQKHDGKVN